MPLDAALTGLVFSLIALLGTLSWIRGRRTVELRAQLTALEEQLARSRPESPPRSPLISWKKGPKRIDLAVVCVEVAGRLRAGDPVDVAWQRTWSRATGGARVEMTDDGVPAALVALATDTSRMVVAATRFSGEIGAPLGEVLLSCAGGLNQLHEGVAAQRVAFAGPRLSARVLTALPLVGLLGGELLGMGSLDWLLSGPLGWMVGILGALFAAAGHMASGRMIAGAAKGHQDALQGPILCDLAAAGLHGGVAIPSVLQAMGGALDEAGFGRAARELLLGARWEEAWDPIPARGDLLARALQPAWEDGVAPTPLLAQMAADARRRGITDAKEAAEKLSVKLAVPLGLLLLPSFVLLGLVPVLFTLIGSQGLPGLG